MADDKAARAKRNSVILIGFVRVLGTEVDGEHRVRNLSKLGACVARAADWQVGARLLVQLGRLAPQLAEIIWLNDTTAGIRFAEAIDLETARSPRGIGLPPTAGWMASIGDAYRTG